MEAEFDETKNQFEIDGILDMRIGPDGEAEYCVKWKNYSGPGSLDWLPEANLDKAPLMMAKFKKRHARRLARAEASTAASAVAPKRRRMSASSCEATPEYSEAEQRERHGHARRRDPPAAEPELQRKLEKPKRKPKVKLHRNSKEIEAASLQQLNCPERSRACPSGRVSTRETMAPHGLIDTAQAPTLATLLDRPPPPPLPPLDAGASGEHSQSQPPDTETLQLLLLDASAKDAGFHSVQSERLLAALRHPACPRLDAAPLDSAGNGCLLRVAATAGPRAAHLLPLLLMRGADPNAVDTWRRSALLLAAEADNGPAVTRLLQFGARPEQRDSRDCTPLWAAANFCRWEAAAALLRHGAEFAQLASLPGFDTGQLKPWSARLSEPLLTAVHRLQASRLPWLPVHLLAAGPPFLAAVQPGALRTFQVAPDAQPDRSARRVRLLVAAVAELDGRGGAALRRVGRSPLGRVTLNGLQLCPLAAVDCLTIYPLEGDPRQEAKVKLAFRPDCPPRCRLKLLAQVLVCVSSQPG